MAGDKLAKWIVLVGVCRLALNLALVSNPDPDATAPGEKQVTCMLTLGRSRVRSSS